jgi:hypothetical protein
MITRADFFTAVTGNLLALEFVTAQRYGVSFVLTAILPHDMNARLGSWYDQA